MKLRVAQALVAAAKELKVPAKLLPKYAHNTGRDPDDVAGVLLADVGDLLAVTLFAGSILARLQEEPGTGDTAEETAADLRGATVYGHPKGGQGDPEIIVY